MRFRLGAPVLWASGSEGIADPTDRESVSLGGASPLSPTIFVELKPQQTGTRLLIGQGEVATTSGSTTFLPGRLIAGHRPLKASVVVRIHPRQPISMQNGECKMQN